MYHTCKSIELNFAEWNVCLSTHKQLEMYMCILSTVATDALVLKYQAISIQNDDCYSAYWNSFIQKYYIDSEQHYKNKSKFWKNDIQ